MVLMPTWQSSGIAAQKSSVAQAENAAVTGSLTSVLGKVVQISSRGNLVRHAFAGY